MSEQGQQELEAKAASVGESRAMAGEGGDRLIERHGRSWRVRVAILGELIPSAPSKHGDKLSPTGFGIGVSVAALDGEGNVAKDALDRFLVFDQHVVTVQPDTFVNDPDFDPELHIQAAIAQEIDNAAATLIGKGRVASALDPWISKEETQ